MPKRRHSLQYLVEPLEEDPTTEQRFMFGGHATYYHGRLVVVLADGEEPWRGVLFPAERDQHAAIRAEFPTLENHAVLPKWLYLSLRHDDFEPLAAAIVACIQARDPRFGVIPERHRKRAGGAPKSARKRPRPGPDGRPPHLL